MRIIGGKARGTKLYTLDGTKTRPTLDRVKESVFNIIQNEIADSIFLDLFSGSGAIGIEAVSRGAKKAVLCDNNKDAINIIIKNVTKTKSTENVRIVENSFENCIKNSKEVFDIIYIDPPYDTDYIFKSLDLIENNNKIINEDTLIIVETNDEDRIIKEISKLKYNIIDKRKYGIAHIIFLKQKLQ